MTKRSQRGVFDACHRQLLIKQREERDIAIDKGFTGSCHHLSSTSSSWLLMTGLDVLLRYIEMMTTVRRFRRMERLLTWLN
jgi:hypothetical protein